MGTKKWCYLKILDVSRPFACVSSALKIFVDTMAVYLFFVSFIAFCISTITISQLGNMKSGIWSSGHANFNSVNPLSNT
jgi:hypothetical protein